MMCENPYTYAEKEILVVDGGIGKWYDYQFNKYFSIGASAKHSNAVVDATGLNGLTMYTGDFVCKENYVLDKDS